MICRYKGLKTRGKTTITVKIFIYNFILYIYDFNWWLVFSGTGSLHRYNWMQTSVATNLSYAYIYTLYSPNWMQLIWISDEISIKLESPEREPWNVYSKQIPRWSLKMNKSKTEHMVLLILYSSINGTIKIDANQKPWIYPWLPLLHHAHVIRKLYCFHCRVLRFCCHLPPSPHDCSNYSVLVP